MPFSPDASSIKAFTTQAKQGYDDFFLPKKTAHTAPITPSPAPTTYANDNHDAFLYHRWNNAHTNTTSTISTRTNKPISAAANSKTIANALTKLSVKDDPSVTPTLKTLSTIDTCSSHSTKNNTDAILSITIWNQPII